MPRRTLTRVYRVAMIAPHVIQYYAPLYRLLAQVPDVDLEVLYCSRAGADEYRDEEMQTTLRWDLDLLSGYRHRFLRNFGRGSGYARLVNPGIVPRLLFGRYDAAIFFTGWGTITALLGIAAARLSNTKILLFGDSSFPPPPQFARDALLRTIFRLTDAFLVTGVQNAAYYRHYGADERRFFPVPFAIDNERFVSASRFAAGEREAMRARFGVHDERMLIVFSAKLIPRKDPLTLLRAVAAMRERAAVLFLGNGELREELERFAREHGVAAHFAGFVNQSELPKHYAAGDVLVLPSLVEPRGLVINEAMACGLPIIASDRVGAIGDLVRDGENAFVFPAGDAEALAHALDRMADPALRARMAARSVELISTWDYAHEVAGIEEALRATC